VRKNSDFFGVKNLNFFVFIWQKNGSISLPTQMENTGGFQ